MMKIGFIGLGRMGSAMAANLASAGHRVIAYVRHRDHMDKLTTPGLAPTLDIAGVFGCDIVISMLPDDDAVRDVVFGRKDLGVEGLGAGLSPGRCSEIATQQKHVSCTLLPPARRPMSSAAGRFSRHLDRRCLLSVAIPRRRISSNCSAT